MTEDQLKALIEKDTDGTITPEEKLALLQELNKGVDELRAIIKNSQE